MVARKEFSLWFPLVLVGVAATLAMALMLGLPNASFTSLLPSDGAGNVGGAAYASLDAVPAGFSPPWNPYDASETPFLDVEPATLANSRVSVAVNAAQDGMLIYKTFYVYQNRSGSKWAAYTFPDAPISGTNWIEDSASKTVILNRSNLSAENYVLVYACARDYDGNWQCGCVNDTDAKCRKWSIQSYSVTAPTMQYNCTGAVPGNATLCAGDNVSLTQNTPINLTASCTGASRCEYTCNGPSYFLNGTKCSLNSSLCGPAACNGKTAGALFCGTNLSRIYSCNLATVGCTILNDTRTCGANQVCATPGTTAQCTGCNTTMPTAAQLSCGNNTGFLCSNAAPWTVNGTVCAGGGACTLNATSQQWGCVGGTPAACSAANVSTACTTPPSTYSSGCWQATCPSGQCVYGPKATGTVCTPTSGGSGTCNATGQCTTSCQSTCTSGQVNTYQCLHNQNCPLMGTGCDQVQQCQQVQTGCYQWRNGASCWPNQTCGAATGTCSCISSLPVACGTACCPAGTTNCGTNSCTQSCTPSKTCASYPNQCGTGFSDGCTNSLTCTCATGTCNPATGTCSGGTLPDLTVTLTYDAVADTATEKWCSTAAFAPPAFITKYRTYFCGSTPCPGLNKRYDNLSSTTVQKLSQGQCDSSLYLNVYGTYRPVFDAAQGTAVNWTETVDSTNAVPESNENNNVASVSMCTGAGCPGTCSYASTTAPPSTWACASSGCAGTNVVVARWNADSRNTITNKINLDGTIQYFDSCCASATSCADNSGACIAQGTFLDPAPAGNQWYLCTKDTSGPYVAVCGVNTYGAGDYSVTADGTTYYCTRTGSSSSYAYGWSKTVGVAAYSAATTASGGTFSLGITDGPASTVGDLMQSFDNGATFILQAGNWLTTDANGAASKGPWTCTTAKTDIIYIAWHGGKGATAQTKHICQ